MHVVRMINSLLQHYFLDVITTAPPVTTAPKITTTPTTTTSTTTPPSQCVPNPCKNSGTCSADGDDFSCSCIPDYTGDTCETGKSFRVLEP